MTTQDLINILSTMKDKVKNSEVVLDQGNGLADRRAMDIKIKFDKENNRLVFYNDDPTVVGEI